MTKTYLRRERAQARAYSQAVVSDGGKVVWLAGQTTAEDSSGNSLVGDFDDQVREVFARLGKTLEDAGGALGDMVTMTVFITDMANGTRFTQLRKEFFQEGRYPASALIGIKELARPEMMVEIQAIAVVD